ncbi:MAG TPA: sensor histidine kinase [Actinomycetota bacterium]|nr:sensor histidine kinase [Actinomycetota bacterium]
MSASSPAAPGHSDVRSWAFDVLIAVASALLNASIVLSLTNRARPDLGGLILALAVVHSLVLIGRRRAPWLSFTLNVATGLAGLALSYPMVVLGLAPLISVYSVASQVRRERSAFALAASLIFLLVATPLTDQTEDIGTIAGNAVGLGGAWLIGTFVYARQFYVRQLEERTVQLQNAREELAEQAVTQERLRIARELHDLVAHSLSVITLRSGVAAHVMDEQPEEVRRSLETIEEVSRNALDEMRRILSMLRDGDAERLPLPGLRDLEKLVASFEDSGVRVDLSMPAGETSLPPTLELTVYRIIQESLTNVLKHASAGTVRVVIQRVDGSMTIEVVDDGVGSSVGANGRGHGLVGMAERVQLFGGTLEAGSLPEGGYRVRAVLPSAEETT